ncbi:Fc.00g024070.m01.CDS01 [Cosmosporella sp. VM-42]
MGDTYVYETLPPIQEVNRTPPFTRILWLEPGSGDDPLSGHLQVINIETPPTYEALSYTWGTDPPSNYLWLDGCPLPIRPNLEAALISLRLPALKRLLWVDAICINQALLDERSRQVQYMRLVYKHAARAIVWVGMKTSGVETAFEMAKRLAQIRDHAKEQQSLGQGAVDPNAVAEFSESILEYMPPESMLYLKELCERPYFSRCWCVQEVVACSWAILKCEELEMPLMDVLGSVFAVAQYEGKLRPNTIFYLWWKIWDSRLPQPSMGPARVEGSLGKLLDLLDITRPLQATDIRDKIFALQGISDEGLAPVYALTEIMGQEGRMLSAFRRGITRLAEGINNLGPGIDFGRPRAFTPNYRKEAIDVYIDVTRFMLRKSPRVLDVLNHVMHTSDPEGGEYPSWVPKWFEPKTNQIMRGYYLAGFCNGHFRYFGEIHDNPMRGNAVRPRVLSIDGFRVDAVQTVTDIMRFDPADDETTVSIIERTWSQLFSFPIVPRSDSKYRDGQPLDVAFCKTISAYPFGGLIYMATQGSITGIDLALPENFKDQFRSSLVDGVQSASKFLDDFALRRAGADSSVTSDEERAKFLMGTRVYSNNRRLFMTREGRLGLGPQVMQAGDEVVVLFGSRVPFVIRPRPDHHIFIGECLIIDDEVMHGRYTERILRKKPGFAPPRMTFELR